MYKCWGRFRAFALRTTSSGGETLTDALSDVHSVNLAAWIACHTFVAPSALTYLDRNPEEEDEVQMATFQIVYTDLEQAIAQSKVVWALKMN
ncbi:MAG: hypothetical protein H6R26_293 [Proteobacteria bacterium]|nr:hypothetical protein [Pseudomonadota bacterium]